LNQEDDDDSLPPLPEMTTANNYATPQMKRAHTTDVIQAEMASARRRLQETANGGTNVTR
jgi:hypothetical protein